MAYISFQPRDFFNTVLYTGDGNNGRTVTGVGFQPDWTWIKSRNRSDVDHILNDSTRGVGKDINSNDNYAEGTSTNKIVSFDSDGFTLNNHVSVNGSSDTYVAWNWLANGGTTSSNSDGSITSTVQANTTAGFSVVSYTGTGTAGTVGHGLGSTVAMVITKSRDSASAWQIYHKDLGKDQTVQLNETAAASTITNYWGTSTPNSTVFGVIGGGYNNNLSGEATIAYCFAEVKGYSKLGSYIGNGSSDGVFVYTGFRPSFVLGKRIDGAGNEWFIFDSKISPSNAVDTYLYASSTAAESGGTDRVDFLSNGFKWRNTAQAWNGSGNTYIYMAFAEFPLIGSNGQVGNAR